MSTQEFALRSRFSPVSWVDTDALRDVAPVLVGIAPFAMVVGLAMSAVAVPVGTGVVGSFLIWGGSAQLAAIALMKSGAGIVSILTTVAVINARFLMYGAVLEPKFRAQPRWFRWFAPHFLVDQNFVLAASRREFSDPARFRRYWLTLSGAIGVVWLSVIGMTLTFGAFLPPDSPVGFASITIFVGLLVPKLAESRARVSALIAAAATIVFTSLFGGVGLLLGIVAGIAVPSFMERTDR